MRWRMVISIRKALTLMLGLAAVVPLAVAMLVADGFLGRLLATSVDNYTHLLAESNRDRVSNGLASIRHVMEQAAILGDRTNFIGYREVLADSKMPFRFFEDYLWISPDGTVEDAVLTREMSPRRRDIIGNDLWNLDIVRRVLLERAPVWSDTMVLVPDSHPTLSLAVPLPSGGALIGVASLDHIDRLVQTGQQGDARVILLDRRGVVFRSGDKERDAERNNIADIPIVHKVVGGLPEANGAFTFDRLSWVGSVMRIPETGWMIIVARTEDSVRKPLLTFQTIAQTTVIGGIIVALLFAAWAGRRLTRPINGLVSEVRNVAAGEYGISRASETGEYIELRELARAFRTMVDEVARRERALEETRDDLRRLNEGLEDAVEVRTRVLRQQAEMLTRTEADAKAAEARLRSVVDSLDSAVFVYDGAGLLVATNRPARILLASYAGTTIFDSDDRGVNHQMVTSTLAEAGLLPATAPWVVDTTITGSWDLGTEAGVFIVVKRFKAEGGYLTEQFIDFTDLRRAQAQLEESERLASLGGLVAGFAHEINTPLGISVTAATQIFDRFAAFEKRFRGDGLRLEDIEKLCETIDEGRDILTSNLDRAARLMRNFKQVSADQTSAEVRAVDVGTYVASVLDSLSPEIRRSRREVRLDVRKRVDAVTQPGAIAQIITNLVLNALRHAFPEGRSGSVEVAVDDAEDGRTVVLTVRDDGIGVPPDIRTRMFEPFFTTKRGTGGTGLGLAIVHNLVVRTLGGTIVCESAPGKGLEIVVRFPAALPGTGGDQPDVA